MANQKLNLKGLILFFVGFVFVSVTALGIGFYLIPVVLDSTEQPAIVVEQLPQKEKEIDKTAEAPPKKEPNTFFISQDGELIVSCGDEEPRQDSRVGVFIEGDISCDITSGANQAKIEAKPNEEYICFANGFSSCRLAAEQEQIEKEEEERALAKKKESVSTKKVKTAQKSTTVKNEADVIVTGPASLSISADIDAVIFVDGKKIRKAPLFKYEVASGSHKVTIVPNGDFANRKEFTLQTESGMNYIRQWSFQNKTWLKKIP